MSTSLGGWSPVGTAVTTYNHRRDFATMTISHYSLSLSILEGDSQAGIFQAMEFGPELEVVD